MAQLDKYVLVVGGGHNYYQPFRKFGQFSCDQGLFSTPDRIALVLFTGGADISPSLYGHKPSNMTWCTPRRDVYELLAYRRASKHSLPLVGVCRGAQFLCAMAGGTLYQHVSGHGRSHAVRTWDDRVVYVTSTHHQMQNPPKGAEVLAWSAERRSEVYLVEDDQETVPPEREYECVYYPNINAVGMQYHPEMMSEQATGFRLAAEMVARCLFEQKEQKKEIAKV